MLIQKLNKIFSRANVTTGQMLHCTTNCIPINLILNWNFPTNTNVFNNLSHRNGWRQREVIWVTYGWYNSNLYLVRNISYQEVKCSTMCMSPAGNQLIATRHSCEVNGCDILTICGCRVTYGVTEVPIGTNLTTLDDVHSNYRQIIKRHTHPQLALRPLMLVNSQKSGHLGQGCCKDWIHISSVSQHKPPKEHFATTTLKLWLAKCSNKQLHIHLVRMPPSIRAQQDRATKSWNQQLWHVLHIWDQSLRAQQHVTLRRRHSQVTKVPDQAPDITTE